MVFFWFISTFALKRKEKKSKVLAIPNIIKDTIQIYWLFSSWINWLIKLWKETKQKKRDRRIVDVKNGHISPNKC